MKKIVLLRHGERAWNKENRSCLIRPILPT